jgi:hypothetical protein
MFPETNCGCTLTPASRSPALGFQRRDEWNGRCVFRPNGKCYDTAMHVFEELPMVRCHESKVERPLCKERDNFDWRGVSSVLLVTVPSTC